MKSKSLSQEGMKGPVHQYAGTGLMCRYQKPELRMAIGLSRDPAAQKRIDCDDPHVRGSGNGHQI